MNKRFKMKDLYDIYPGKWVLFVNSEDKDGFVDTCEVYAVFETEKEGEQTIRDLFEDDSNGYTDISLWKMVKGEDDVGFVYISSS
ncbi:MAG: hypothetical protein FWG68_12765 [Defluviitaleaceae bacterium]|nr:hypothetical protein [Defluviitaleaceae bacterium]